MKTAAGVIGAVDIGGTKIAAGLVSGQTVIARSEVPTAQVLPYGAGLEQISAMLRAMLGAIESPLLGIGIGLTGRVESISRRIGRNDFLKDWAGRDLAGDLAALFGVGVGIENDADAAALAEAAWGVGQGRSPFIYVTISTGIGGGIVVNGRLYRGVGGAHPEIGHHSLDLHGPDCFCGGRGCWERFASGTAMLDWARSHEPEAAAMANLDARQICDLAESGSAWARRVVRREAEYLGLGLANLATLFAPQQIGLGGGVMRRWDLFEEIALQTVKKNCGLVPVDHILISRAQLGEETPLIGASQAWVQQFDPEG